jgi:hypothetical protein
MAVTSKVLARTAAATSSTTLYTVPNSSTTTVVTNIVATNTAAAEATFTITIPSNSSVYIDLKQVIPANATPKVIAGLASATTVNFHISGVEIA